MIDDWELVERRPDPIKRMGIDPSLRVGLIWPTANGPAGRPDVLDRSHHARLAAAAEHAGFDFVLLTDGYRGSGVGGDAGLRPVLWAVEVIGATRHLGVVTTMRTSFMHPTHIARFGAHLDWLSGGRWGWNVATGAVTQGPHYGMDTRSSSERLAVAREAIAAVDALWRLPPGERIELDGPTFRIVGQLKRPRPLQTPRPPLFGPAALADFGIDYAFTRAVDHDSSVASHPAQVVVMEAGAGTPAELADRMIAAHVAGAAGCLLRIDDWSERAVRSLSDTFARLQPNGVWRPPADRDHAW